MICMQCKHGVHPSIEHMWLVSFAKHLTKMLTFCSSIIVTRIRVWVLNLSRHVLSFSRSLALSLAVPCALARSLARSLSLSLTLSDSCFLSLRAFLIIAIHLVATLAIEVQCRPKCCVYHVTTRGSDVLYCQISILLQMLFSLSKNSRSNPNFIVAIFNSCCN